jgi:hypothetical protein
LAGELDDTFKAELRSYSLAPPQVCWDRIALRVCQLRAMHDGGKRNEDSRPSSENFLVLGLLNTQWAARAKPKVVIHDRLSSTCLGRKTNKLWLDIMSS